MKTDDGDSDDGDGYYSSLLLGTRSRPATVLGALQENLIRVPCGGIISTVL